MGKASITLEVIRIAKISMRVFMKNFAAVSCEHRWRKNGRGYKCLDCDFYTGTNSVLNAEIKELVGGKDRGGVECLQIGL